MKASVDTYRNLTASSEVAPRVSVIVVTYNHEAYISQAIESVLAQRTEFPFEIIITEDCSTDGTGRLVEAAADRHPETIRLVRSQVNLCSNAVTSRALQMAKGEYVAFIDGDDYWTSADKLSKQVKFLDENPEFSICCHDVVIVDDAGEVLEPSFRRRTPAPDTGSYEDIVWSDYIAGPSPMIRRSALADLPPWFDDAEFGDWPLYMIAAEQGLIGFLPETLGAYRIHSGGYWNGMGEEQRHRDCVLFMERAWRHASPSRRPALSRSLSIMTNELLDWHLRRRGLASAARTLCALVVRGLRDGNLQWVLKTVSKSGAALGRRALGPFG